MFTGIVDRTGKISQILPSKSGVTIEITADFSDLTVGESVAVDGVCLTVIDPTPTSFRANVSPETQRLTLAGNYENRSLVNLERPLRLSDRLGGHYVTGHVDQTGVVASKKKVEDYWELTFKGVLPSQRNFLTKKGSVAVNGVSLTVNEVFDDGFTVCLIPHTLERTNLSLLEEGSSVNLEFDWMAKMVSEQVERLWKK